ncbi:UNVERIFIED_CONTAM: hypothetical protein NCL1_56112 [Trichonephila clavipes]
MMVAIASFLNRDETLIPFFDVPTHQKSKVWVFEDDATPTMVKRQRKKKNNSCCYFQNVNV